MMKYRTLRAAFRAIDTDNDHAVDWSEVQRLLRNFNMDSNDKHLHQIFLDAANIQVTTKPKAKSCGNE